MAFAFSNYVRVRSNGFVVPVVCKRRTFVCTSQTRQPSRYYQISATYQNDLDVLTFDIDHGKSDELVSKVQGMLDRKEALGETILQDMVVHLGDSRGMSRLSIVEAFGRVGSPALSVLLVGLKTCPNPVVRRSCGKALAKIGDASATDCLIETLLTDVDTVTRASAAGALAKMGSAAVPKLLAVISSPDSNMTAQGHAAWAISFMQGTASEALFERARDPSVDVRLAVVSALGSVAIGDALPVMSGTGIDDWASDVLDENNIDLSKQRKRAIEVLVSSLCDESSEVRGEAMTALANAGVQEVAAKCLEFLRDEDFELRRTAALALMKLGYTEGIDRLEELVNDDEESESVRKVASLAVKSLRSASISV
jgi:bilin biosynthesis protein